ncbi:hypothetical protein PZ938_10145 [Luteipulveratus sp. YIM 133132]|uniref:hypothetical protein n=1 Tax=Luteipulveratus flavus TaxID=3031728 RepID=UPI0023B136A8|nr:hypothetical protein [Luteipulveratus sp. YIM 133132]MDE9365963.1 hypothetical protein [Luteipulveratus sp. YIM 133132]
MAASSIGKVDSIDGGEAQVLLGDGAVPATVTDQVRPDVTVGSRVLLIPVGPVASVTWVVVGTVPGTEAAQLNMVPNGDFAAGSTEGPPPEWDQVLTRGEAQLAWTGDPGSAHSGGVGAAQVVIAASQDATVHDTVMAQPVLVDGGAAYDTSAWAQSVSGVTGQLLLLSAPEAEQTTLYDPAAVLSAPTPAPVPLVGAGTWVQTGGPCVIPADHTWARIVLRTTAPQGMTAVAWWSDVSLTARS